MTDDDVSTGHVVRPGWAPVAACFFAAIGEGVPQNTEENA